MNSVSQKIIDYIKRNRVSTTEVADALGKTGAISNVVPINRGHFRVGEIKWVYAYDVSNWSVHEQIKDIEENYIVLVDAFDCEDRAIFGELVSKYLLLYRQCKAIIVRGKLRDAAALIRQNWPIWCEGFNPVGCFNRKPEQSIDVSMINEYRNNFDGAIAVCDDCGVVIIPKDKISEEFLFTLQHIENQEDIWFDRLDHYKETTFDIVCKKLYLKDSNYHM